MRQGTVGECGQVALPRDFLDAADIDAGDFVLFRVTGPNTIELSLYHRLTLEEMFEKYRIDGPIDLEVDRDAMYDELAEAFVRRMEAESMAPGHPSDEVTGSDDPSEPSSVPAHLVADAR